MAINFPDSPTIGDEFTGGGFTWTWNGSSWEKVSSLSSSNDFGVNLSSATTYNLDATYPAGIYAITITNNDTSFDIYAISTNGESCGYTNSGTIEITDNFNQLSILGVPADERILFYFQGAVAIASGTGNALKGGAFIDSVVTSALPNIDDTTVINGGNFAADVEVTFIGQNNNESDAKSVVRSSSTEIIATRPDSFAVSNSPYSVRVTNPGISRPSGSGIHVLSNSVTAGTMPSWSTGSSVGYNLTQPTLITLAATDTEGSDISYSVFSGSLPSGLSLDSGSGVISGTFSGSASEGDSTSITFRATDAGGNFVDKSISLVANSSPAWTTGSLLPSAGNGESYSLQLQASSGSVGGAITYTLQSGSLPGGLSLSSSGNISGTMTDANNTSQTFTIRATDSLLAFADKEFTLQVKNPIIATGGTKTTVDGYVYHTFTSNGTFSVSSNSASQTCEFLVVGGGGGGAAVSGGGGAGGYRTSSFVPSATNYSVTVGGGGSRGTGDGATAGNGSSSSFNNISSAGGGAGGNNANSGGSGGGTRYTNFGAGNVPSVSPPQGYDGGQSFGGGGGATEAGNTIARRAGGTGAQWLDGNYYAGGGAGGGVNDGGYPGSLGGGGGNTGSVGIAGDVNSGGGGGGGQFTGSGVVNAGAVGGSGVVIVRYAA